MDLQEEVNEQSEMCPEDLDKMYSESFRNLKVGEIVDGKVIDVTKDFVTVDINYKSEGVIPVNEFVDENGDVTIKDGDTVKVYLEALEDNEGLAVLSKRRADFLETWESVAKAYDEDREVEGTVVRSVKGGLQVDIGVNAFLPASQIDIRPVQNLQSYIGKKLSIKIIKLNRKRNNIVLSRRILLEKERAEGRERILRTIEVGQSINGVVKNLTSFGAFVDLGGIDGLIHITDLSWGRVRHPSDVLTIGDKISCKVLAFDEEKGKISLGLKQNTPNPWETIEQKYPPGTRVPGRVVNITDYGAFVELEEGIEGLIHISEMSWTKRIIHPNQILSLGDRIECVVLNINVAEEKISLGLKQIEANPWDSICDRYKIGMIAEGVVRNLADFGAFIEIEEGIDGLVHISDMSWTRHIGRPSELMKKGETVKVRILDIDKDNQKISLGIKQLDEDPWTTVVPSNYRVGDKIEVTITRITNHGAYANIGNDMDGLIPLYEIAADSEVTKRNIDAHLKIDDKITVKIIKVDNIERKISLSIKRLNQDVGKDDIARYQAKGPITSNKATFSDTLSAEMVQKLQDVKKSIS